MTGLLVSGQGSPVGVTPFTERAASVLPGRSRQPSEPSLRVPSVSGLYLPPILDCFTL